MADLPPPEDAPPIVDAVTAAQSALDALVRAMFESAGALQRDAPPASDKPILLFR